MLLDVKELTQIYHLLQEFPQANQVNLIVDFVSGDDTLYLLAEFLDSNRSVLGAVTIGPIRDEDLE